MNQGKCCEKLSEDTVTESGPQDPENQAVEAELGCEGGQPMTLSLPILGLNICWSVLWPSCFGGGVWVPMTLILSDYHVFMESLK